MGTPGPFHDNGYPTKAECDAAREGRYFTFEPKLSATIVDVGVEPTLEPAPRPGNELPLSGI